MEDKEIACEDGEKKGAMIEREREREREIDSVCGLCRVSHSEKEMQRAFSSKSLDSKSSEFTKETALRAVGFELCLCEALWVKNGFLKCIKWVFSKILENIM